MILRMSKLPIFEYFLSVGNLKPKLKPFFKPKLKPKKFLLNPLPEVQQLPWLQAIFAKARFPKVPKRAMTKMGRLMTTFFAVPMSGDYGGLPEGTLVVRGVLNPPPSFLTIDLI